MASCCLVLATNCCDFGNVKINSGISFSSQLKAFILQEYEREVSQVRFILQCDVSGCFALVHSVGSVV